MASRKAGDTQAVAAARCGFQRAERASDGGRWGVALAAGAEAALSHPGGSLRRGLAGGAGAAAPGDAGVAGDDAAGGTAAPASRRLPGPAAALAAAPGRPLAGDRGPGARSDLSPGASAGPPGALGLHRRGRPRCHRLAGGRSPIGCTISGSPTAAGSSSRRSAAGRASPRSPRPFRRRSGSSAACRATHRTDRLSAAYRNLGEPGGRGRPAMPSSAATTASSRPATMPASPTRTARSKPPTAISRPRSRRRSSCAARATSPILPPTRPSSHEIVARKNARRAAAVAIELKALRPLPAPPHDRLLASHRRRDPLRHHHRAQRPLHRTLAPDRQPPQGAYLR